MVSVQEAQAVASLFQIPQPVEVEDFAGKGNINLDTLFVTAGPERTPYLLQRINTDVFPMPERVMAGMISVLESQHDAIHRGHPNAHEWRAPILVPTLDGEPFLLRNGAWRMMTYLEGTVSYKSLSEVTKDHRLEIAQEVGRGLAVYSDLTSGIDASQVPVSLPGYRNTRLYFHQLHCALEGVSDLIAVADRLPSDPEVLASSERHFLRALPENDWRARRNDPALSHFIDLALRHEPLALMMQDLREDGTIRETAIHGDTKIENFLFDAQTGKVVALIDLDTVMPHSWLADWGDMVRSLANVAGEKERDLSQVQVNAGVYEAVLRGFLGATNSATEEEIELMPQAVQTIALELGIRFLADYLRGDTYFKLAPGDPEDLNRTRALVQLTLFERLLEHEPQARRAISACRYRAAI